MLQGGNKGQTFYSNINKAKLKKNNEKVNKVFKGYWLVLFLINVFI